MRNESKVQAQLYTDSDYDIPIINSVSPPYCTSNGRCQPVMEDPNAVSPKSKRKISRPPALSEESLGLSEKQYDNFSSSQDGSRPFLKTNLHRGSMCGPPPQGFRDLLLDMSDEEVPWQIASVKREVGDIDIGDVDPSDPVYQIVQRRQKVALRKQHISPDPHVHIKKQSHREYYAGSSLVMEEDSEGTIMMASDKKARRYNKFRRQHLVESLDQVEEEDTRQLLESRMFVQDYEDYESVSSGSISIFGNSDEEMELGVVEEGLVGNASPLLHQCVSVESLLSDIIDIADIPEPESSDKPQGSPIYLNKNYDFEVHKTIVVTEVDRNDPSVQDLIKSCTNEDPASIESRTFSSQCTVWLRPDKQRIISPVGEPKIYSADVTCMYGDKTVSSEITPGKEMSIFFRPHSSDCPVRSAEPDEIPLKLEIVEKPLSSQIPSPDKQIHITYCSSLSPSKKFNPTELDVSDSFNSKLEPNNSRENDPISDSIDTSVSADSGVGKSLRLSKERLEKTSSPQDSGICSPSMAIIPKTVTSPEHSPIPERDRILTISGSSSEGIERDYPICKEKPLLEQIPESTSPNTRTYKPKVFSYAVNTRAPKEKRKKDNTHESPEEAPTDDDGEKNNNSANSGELISKSSPEEVSMSDDTDSNEREEPKSESLYSVGEVCLPNTPDSDLEFYTGEDMIFDDTEQATYEYIPVFKAMLEIFDAAISDKEDHLTYLRDAADSCALQGSFSECYDLLPYNYQARADVLNESLSEDSDSPATSKSWLTFGSKSSAGSSMEIADNSKPYVLKQPLPLVKDKSQQDTHHGQEKPNSKIRSSGSNLQSKPKRHPTKASVLPDNYKDRAAVLDESLSDDSELESSSRRWLSFSPKSSVKSSFEDNSDEPIPVMTPAIKYDANQQRLANSQMRNQPGNSRARKRKSPVKEPISESVTSPEGIVDVTVRDDEENDTMASDVKVGPKFRHYPRLGSGNRSILPKNYQETAEILDESLSEDSDTYDAPRRWLNLGIQCIPAKDEKVLPKCPTLPSKLDSQFGTNTRQPSKTDDKTIPDVDSEGEVAEDMIFDEYDTPATATIPVYKLESILRDNYSSPIENEPEHLSQRSRTDKQFVPQEILCTYFASNNDVATADRPPAEIEAILTDSEPSYPKIQSVQDQIVVEVEEPNEIILDTSSSTSDDDITAEDLYKDGPEDITVVPRDIIIQDTDILMSGLAASPITQIIATPEQKDELGTEPSEDAQRCGAAENSPSEDLNVKEVPCTVIPPSANKKSRKKKERKHRKNQGPLNKSDENLKKDFIPLVIDEIVQSEPYESHNLRPSIESNDNTITYTQESKPENYVEDSQDRNLNLSECNVESIPEKLKSRYENIPTNDTEKLPITNLCLNEELAILCNEHDSPDTLPENITFLSCEDEADVLHDNLSDDSDTSRKRPSFSPKAKRIDMEKAFDMPRSAGGSYDDINPNLPCRITDEAHTTEFDDSVGTVHGDVVQNDKPMTDGTPDQERIPVPEGKAVLSANPNLKAAMLDKSLSDDSESETVPAKWLAIKTADDHNSSADDNDELCRLSSLSSEVAPEQPADNNNIISPNRDVYGNDYEYPGKDILDTEASLLKPSDKTDIPSKYPRNVNDENHGRSSGEMISSDDLVNEPELGMDSTKSDLVNAITITLPQMWCEDISSSENPLVEVECDSFDEKEVALSHQKTGKLLHGKVEDIPKISIEPAKEDSVRSKRKKKRNKTRKKPSGSPHKSHHDTVPPNTPLDNIFSDNPFLEDADLCHAITTSAYNEDDEALTSPIEIDFVDKFETSPMFYNKSNRDFSSNKADSSPRLKKKSKKKKKSKSPLRHKPTAGMPRSNSEPFNLSELGNDMDDGTLDLLIPVSRQQSDQESTGFSPEKTSPFLSSDDSPVPAKAGVMLEALGETEEEDEEMEEIEDRKDRKTIATYLPMPLLTNQSSLEAHSLSPVFELTETADQCPSDSKDDEESDETTSRLLPRFTEPADDEVYFSKSSYQSIDLLNDAQNPRGVDEQAGMNNVDIFENGSNDESSPSPEELVGSLSPIHEPLPESEVGADLIFGDVDMPYDIYVPEYTVEISESEYADNESGASIPQTGYENEDLHAIDGKLSDESSGEVCEDMVFEESDSFVDEMIQVYEVVYENLIAKNAEKESQTDNESCSKSTQSTVEVQDMATAPEMAKPVNSETQCPRSQYADKGVLSIPPSVDKDTQSFGSAPNIIDLHDKSVQSQPCTPECSSEIEISDASSQAFLSMSNSEAASQVDLLSPPPVVSTEVQCSYHGRDEEVEADIWLSNVSRSSQSDDIQQTSNSIQTDPNPEVNNIDTQCSPVISDSSSQADIKPENVSACTQSDAEIKTPVKAMGTQAVAGKRNIESQANPCVRDTESGADYVSSSDVGSQAEDMEKDRPSSTDVFVQVVPKYMDTGSQMSIEDEDDTLDLICEEIFSDEEIIVELDEKAAVETEMKSQVESVDIGVQFDEPLPTEEDLQVFPFVFIFNLI